MSLPVVYDAELCANYRRRLSRDIESIERGLCALRHKQIRTDDMCAAWKALSIVDESVSRAFRRVFVANATSLANYDWVHVGIKLAEDMFLSDMEPKCGGCKHCGIQQSDDDVDDVPFFVTIGFVLHVLQQHPPRNSRYQIYLKEPGFELDSTFCTREHLRSIVHFIQQTLSVTMRPELLLTGCREFGLFVTRQQWLYVYRDIVSAFKTSLPSLKWNALLSKIETQNHAISRFLTFLPHENDCKHLQVQSSPPRLLLTDTAIVSQTANASAQNALSTDEQRLIVMDVQDEKMSHLLDSKGSSSPVLQEEIPKLEPPEDVSALESNGLASNALESNVLESDALESRRLKANKSLVLQENCKPKRVLRDKAKIGKRMHLAMLSSVVSEDDVTASIVKDEEKQWQPKRKHRR